jgi:hypothetical protein
MVESLGLKVIRRVARAVTVTSFSERCERPNPDFGRQIQCCSKPFALPQFIHVAVFCGATDDGADIGGPE